MRKKLLVPEIIIFLLILLGGIFMFGLWKTTRLNFLDTRDQLTALDIKNKLLENKIRKEQWRYDSLTNENSLIEDSLAVMRAEIAKAEISYQRLADVHEMAIDSLRQLHDTLMVETLLAQVGYDPRQRDTSVLVPMLVIRVAVIKIQQGEHCIEEKEELTDMYEEVKEQVGTLERANAVKAMKLISAETMLTDKDKTIDLKIKEVDLYRKEVKRQKVLKIIFIGLSAVMGSIAIAK